jgi:hypothetical protein
VVAYSGKTLHVSSYKPVNLPESVQVVESPSGGPAAVKTTTGQTVTAVDDCWRIDDEWWRGEPVTRLYYTVRVNSGQRLVVYKDLVSGKWYKQSY